VTRVGALFASLRQGAPATVFDRLCEGCARELGLTGVGVVLILGDRHRGTIGASDARIKAIEDLQFTFGEGPCVDAHRTSRLVAAPTLQAESTRWPAFAPAAVDAGVAAVFALPLRVGAGRFGALDLYRDEPGELPAHDLADAAVVADAATVLLLAVQAEVPEGSLPDALADLAEHRAVVHQAAGMVSVQLDVSVEDALVALRARAFQRGSSVGALADEIVARRVRLDE
jgi:hypothetical protein